MAINNSSPPPPPAPLDRPSSSTSGSSFKPLHLSSHPWVRAHLRPAPNNGQKPRLSFLALHYHMHGRESFSEPPENTGASSPEESGRGARHRNSPEALSKALGMDGTSVNVENVSGGNTRTSYMGASKQSVRYFSCKTAESPTPERELTIFGRRSQSDVGQKHGVSLPNPGDFRSISAPELRAPPVAVTYARSTDHRSHDSRRLVKRNRTRGEARGSSAPPLAMASLPAAFTGVITTSEGAFGSADLVLKPELQKKATAKWLRQSRKKRKHDADKKASLDNEGR